MLKALAALVAILPLLASCAATPHRAARRSAPPHTTGLTFHTIRAQGVERDIALYAPRTYTPAQPWPCVVFLNGSGECGTDGQRQLTQGLFPAMINAPADWPMIAVFPQKPDRASTWADHDELVMNSLALAQSLYNIDASRIYLTGLSQGGAGTWAIGAKHPGVFAAIAPVCGFGNPADCAPALAHTPVWAFHGEKDDVVQPAQTLAFVSALERTSGATAQRNPPSGRALDNQPANLRVTIYPDLNHGCWDRTYRDMELGEWLLSWSLPRAQK